MTSNTRSRLTIASRVSPRSRLVGRLALVGIFTVLGLQTVLWAIQPGQWTHTTEADFLAGKTQDTVVTNLGDIKLAAGTTNIGRIAEQATVIYDLQPTSDGAIYIAAGPEARLLRKHGDRIEQVAQLEQQQIFCLDVDSTGRLLAGISGEKSQIAVMENGKLTPLVELEGVRYVWDMLVSGKRITAATGTDGKVLQVDLSGSEPKVTELLDAAQANVLCLAKDNRGRIYAGTDTDGLVYRITLGRDGDAESFVLFDAPEPEIGAILVAHDGTVYAGTADAEQARPGRLSEAGEAESGRLQAAPVELTPSEAPPAQPGDLPQVPPQPGPIGQDQNQPSGAPGTPPTPTPPGGSDAPSAPDRPTPNQQMMLRLQSHAGNVAALQANDGEATADEGGPTAEQHDRLRELIRQRLEQARKTGALQEQPPMPPHQPMPQPGGPRGRGPIEPGGGPTPPPRSAGSEKPGNAVYRIDANGFVREVFRESTMVLKLLENNGMLLVATGSEGQLFRIDPVTEETTILADLDEQQIPAILIVPGNSPAATQALIPATTQPDDAATQPAETPAKSGKDRKKEKEKDKKKRDAKAKADKPAAQTQDQYIILGTANPASLVRLDRGFAQEGTFTSAALDAQQISLWGRLQITLSTPSDTSVSIQTRSGNVEDPEQAAWSPWSEAAVIDAKRTAGPLQPVEVDVQSPPARFLQYRLTLHGSGQQTPTIERVDLAYVVPNLKPRVTSIQASYPNAPAGGQSAPGGGQSDAATPSAGPEADAPPTNINIEWQATDPNNDRMRYTLEYQPAGASRWLTLAKDLQQTTHEWDTRRVPDGRYLLRVLATDAPDNPGDMARLTVRQSDPVLVDNTPPVFEKIDQKLEPAAGTFRLHVTALVRDALLPIRSLYYRVDDQEQWQPAMPDDLIFDSTAETVAVTISGLAPGPHVVTLRSADARGNARYQALIVEAK